MGIWQVSEIVASGNKAKQNEKMLGLPRFLFQPELSIKKNKTNQEKRI